MVQIIDENRKRTTAEKFSNAVGTGIEAFEKIKNKTEQKKLLKEENDAAKKLGVDLTGIVDPKMRQQIMVESLKGINKNKLFKEQMKLFDENENEPENKITNEDQLPFSKDKDNVDQSKKTSNKKPYPENKIAKMSIINPALAREMRAANDAVTQQQKLELGQQKEQTRKSERIDEQTKKFDETLNDQATAADKKNRALERQMKLVDKVGWYDRMVSVAFGNTPMGNLLKSDNAVELDANTLPQMEGQRAILGGILSDSDIRLLMQKIVTSDKSPEANKRIAKSMTMENNLMIAKKRIGDEIKAKNDGLRPANYEAEIEKVYNERYGKDIQDMFDSIMSLPDDEKKISKFRRKVPPGTKLNNKAIDFYLEITKNNPDEAQLLASEDGYDIL